MIAWFSRLFTIKNIHKIIDELRKRIDGLHQNTDLIANQLERCSLSNTALQKQAKAQTQKLEEFKISNKQLQNKISDLSFPTEKISDIKNKKNLSKELEVIQRIKAKKYQIDFERIGYASNLNKDNLRLIVGIGAFIEQKLNTLGIYTFEQIANCTPQDVLLITDAIEFFSGQIKKDKWVTQAQKLKHSKAEN